MDDAQTVTIAHLSDLHLPPVAGFWPRYWNVKRTLGWLNWQRKRRFVHTRTALDAITADLKAQSPDHILVSGDLVNIGLPAEYSRARQWLESLGSPDRISVVPGNHDAYVEPEASNGIASWGPYMTSNDGGLSLGGQPTLGRDTAGQTPLKHIEFPFVRTLPGVAIVGVNSGIPTLPGSAIGAVGEAQLNRLDKVLHQIGQTDLMSLVMIHHPPAPGLAKPGRALSDAAQLASVLKSRGVNLVVHGHNHTLTSSMHAGFAIEGVGSASAARPLGHEPQACYKLYRFARQSSGTNLNVETRSLNMADGSISAIDARTLIGHSF